MFVRWIGGGVTSVPRPQGGDGKVYSLYRGLCQMTPLASQQIQCLHGKLMEPVSWLQNESPRQNINLALIVVSQS